MAAIRAAAPAPGSSASTNRSRVSAICHSDAAASGIAIGLVAAAAIEAAWWIQGRVRGEPRILWRSASAAQQ